MDLTVVSIDRATDFLRIAFPHFHGLCEAAGFKCQWIHESP
jgi:hypothetical protein